MIKFKGNYLLRQSPFINYGNQEHLWTLSESNRISHCAKMVHSHYARGPQWTNYDLNIGHSHLQCDALPSELLVRKRSPTLTRTEKTTLQGQCFTIKTIGELNSSPRLTRTVNFRVRAECITIILQGNIYSAEVISRISYISAELVACFVTKTIILLVNRISKQNP